MPAVNALILYDAGSNYWLSFRSPLQILVAHDRESVVRTLRNVEQAVNTLGLYAAGFVSYEAAPAFDHALTTHPPDEFPLAWFALYPEPLQLSSTELPAQNAPNRLNDIPWRASVTPEEYRQAFQAIKERIANGETYQVNYSFRLRAPFRDDPWQLFSRMIHCQGSTYGAFINTERWAICSASPELFFARSGKNLICHPMKGTAPRGWTLLQDKQQAEALATSGKNRAENVMIVDMVRNDMGRLSDKVEVTDLYRIEKYPTLWQMTSAVRCTTGSGLSDIFGALYPAASITGAPKIRTTEIIASLENTPRRIYTGAIGFVAPDGRAQFNVAIRTVLIDKLRGSAEYGLGGGITWDSENHVELEECYVKARIVTGSHSDFELLESIRWTPDCGFYLLDEHLARLAASAAYFDYPLKLGNVRSKLDALSHTLQACAHKIRLRLDRDGNHRIDAAPLVDLPSPYRVGIARNPIDTKNVFLYHKTTNRTPYDQALLDYPACDDLLLWNERGELTESCRANIAAEVGGELLTPPVSCGLLPGTMRSALLKEGRVREAILNKSELGRFTAIYLVNAVRGLWRVFP